MRDIDFIKWMCEKAEGCRLGPINGTRIHFYCEDIPVAEVGSIRFDTVYYPLLLQRAIEGTNTRYDSEKNYKFCVHQEEWGITVIDEREKPYESGFGNCESFYRDDNDGWDKAKESALQFIYEQEKQ